MSANDRLIVRDLGLRDYEPVWRAMQAFTANRGPDTPDELWLVQHPPVFTLGQAAKPEHLLAPGDIPVVQIDRGGQVTYHGPGQLVAYLLADIRRRGLGVQALVRKLEQAIIEVLAGYGVHAWADRAAPGVYVEGGKIAALGLRIKHGGSYHGLAFNIDMDLEPFSRINPCGHPGMAVTQLKNLGISHDITRVNADLVSQITRQLGYTGTSANQPQPSENGDT
ncbi:lipoyl(octanoyl) transferase LipB [Thiohalobacter thiocyanaticus]|uniref:Octanoyltransferase n=1 Tax=Thiohalobacter thiocyanaticus TaxID=585455 RepID=A0A426QKS1_9GAMM|nr:lipoyl(octanoyl) transferase LipB [Thiohalobacter thiocyanaticus]RRQ22355.1 lipoyl(octanoyl) transferase LipB [Thiohalobacter thiocyanaticus]